MESIVILWLSCGGSTSDEKLELGCSGPISGRVVEHWVGLGREWAVGRRGTVEDLSGQADRSEPQCFARPKAKA